MPGHEGLVHNMLAGATGIDFVMLVIAADDGVMPQTREHLAIMDLLGLEHGVVALNKCDLVGADRLAAVDGGDSRPSWRAPACKDAEILPVSAVTGEGLDVLAARLDAALVHGRLRVRGTGSSAWRSIARSRWPGLGTAVTGTVLSGSVRVEDRVMISPSGLEARVRSINAQNRPVRAGRRPDSDAPWC